MALSMFSSSSTSTIGFHSSNTRTRKQTVEALRNVNIIKCESTGDESIRKSTSKKLEIKIGSPIIVIEAPKMIKTAASVPCLRVNSGLVKAGDVGRIVSRKPMDVWAVRLSIGTYLLDGKYFKPLELN